MRLVKLDLIFEMKIIKLYILSLNFSCIIKLYVYNLYFSYINYLNYMFILCNYN